MIPITLPLLMALEIRSVRLVTRLTAALITIIGHKKQAYKVSPTEDHDPLSLTTTHRIWSTFVPIYASTVSRPSVRLTSAVPRMRVDCLPSLTVCLRRLHLLCRGPGLDPGLDFSFKLNGVTPFSFSGTTGWPISLPSIGLPAGQPGVRRGSQSHHKRLY